MFSQTFDKKCPTRQKFRSGASIGFHSLFTNKRFFYLFLTSFFYDHCRRAPKVEFWSWKAHFWAFKLDMYNYWRKNLSFLWESPSAVPTTLSPTTTEPTNYPTFSPTKSPTVELSPCSTVILANGGNRIDGHYYETGIPKGPRNTFECPKCVTKLSSEMWYFDLILQKDRQNFYTFIWLSPSAQPANSAKLQAPTRFSSESAV